MLKSALNTRYDRLNDSPAASRTNCSIKPLACSSSTGNAGTSRANWVSLDRVFQFPSRMCRFGNFFQSEYRDNDLRQRTNTAAGRSSGISPKALIAILGL